MFSALAYKDIKVTAGLVISLPFVNGLEGAVYMAYQKIKKSLFFKTFQSTPLHCLYTASNVFPVLKCILECILRESA
jgi:hypothetical protein